MFICLVWEYLLSVMNVHAFCKGKVLNLTMCQPQKMNEKCIVSYGKPKRFRSRRSFRSNKTVKFERKERKKEEEIRRARGDRLQTILSVIDTNQRANKTNGDCRSRAVCVNKVTGVPEND